MYYFGTNLDQKFSVPGFWPGPNQTHKIPFEKEEIDAELARLKARRLEHRRKRLEEEAKSQEQ
jgi:protein PET100